MLRWPGLVGQGTEPGRGAAVPCPPPGKRFRGRGTCQGHLGHSCAAALPWPGKEASGAGMIWRACLGGLCRHRGFHLCSVSFCRSPQGLGGRRRALGRFAGISDRADLESSEEAAGIRIDQGAVLLALQSQGEVKLSLGKWKIKAASAKPVPWCPSRGERPEHAEQAASFLPSAAACRTAHPSAHPGRSRV